MTNENIIKEMARLEGLEIAHPDQLENVWVIDEQGSHWSASDYTEDHNAVLRVYKTLTLQQKRAVVEELRIPGVSYFLTPNEVGLILSKPASDWCNAILKAVGKWEESE